MKYNGYCTLRKGDHILIAEEWYEAKSASWLELDSLFRRRGPK